MLRYAITVYVLLYLYCNSIYVFMYRVPDRRDVTYGAIQQGSQCFDILSRVAGEPVGLFVCHNTGGNQVRVIIYKLCNYSVVKCLMTKVGANYPNNNRFSHKTLMHCKFICLT